MQSSQNLTAFFSPPEVKVAKELVRSVEEEDDEASVEFLRESGNSLLDLSHHSSFALSIHLAKIQTLSQLLLCGM